MSTLVNCAAFFDLDGTLLPPPSLERRFIDYLLRRGELSFAQAARWLGQFLTRVAFDFSSATEGNKTYLAGLSASLADDWTRSREGAPVAFFAEGLRLLNRHAAQGHRIFLVSGTLAPLALDTSHRLPVPTVACATQLEICDGCWTGRIRSELISGEAKARAVERLAAGDRLDLETSYAYGDRSADIPMLKSVGHPVAINPSPALERVAGQRGWPVLQWHQAARAKTPGFFAPSVVTARRIPPLHAARGQR